MRRGPGACPTTAPACCLGRLAGLALGHGRLDGGRPVGHPAPAVLVPGVGDQLGQPDRCAHRHRGRVGSLTVMISDRGRPWWSLKKAMSWTWASIAPVCRSALGCLFSKSSTGSKSLPTVKVMPLVSMTRRICGFPPSGTLKCPRPASCGEVKCGGSVCSLSARLADPLPALRRDGCRLPSAVVNDRLWWWSWPVRRLRARYAVVR